MVSSLAGIVIYLAVTETEEFPGSYCVCDRLCSILQVYSSIFVTQAWVRYCSPLRAATARDVISADVKHVVADCDNSGCVSTNLVDQLRPR